MSLASRPTLALIDYGSGNLRSMEKAVREAARCAGREHAVVVTDDPEVVAAADRVVLPGVSSFGACMEALAARPGLIEGMTEAARSKGRPFLGACSGMQLLATRGEEFGEHRGLDWIPGEVRRLQPADSRCKVPHMGWNDVRATRDHPLFGGSDEYPAMYFTHSYALRADDPEAAIAEVDHGGAFTAAVAKDNIAGVQFHPEKSQAAGLALIGRFLEWAP